MKVTYKNTNNLDRLLSNGHQLLINHIGHLRAKNGPGTRWLGCGSLPSHSYLLTQICSWLLLLLHVERDGRCLIVRMFNIRQLNKGLVKGFANSLRCTRLK
jgi:hypothetical protein